MRMEANVDMSIAIIVGTVVGFFAGLLAFLITYEEYSHHYIDKKNPLKAAFEAAIFAFFVFWVLSIITGFVLIKAYMK